MNLTERLDDNSGAYQLPIPREARIAVNHYRERVRDLNNRIRLEREAGREYDATNGHYWRILVERALDAEIVDPRPEGL